jgi:hypothetical protein
VPDALDSFSSSAQALLQQHHGQIKRRPELLKRKATSLKLLDDQVRAHSQSFRDLKLSIRRTIEDQKREANRLYTIKDAMMETYAACGQERGRF